MVAAVLTAANRDPRRWTDPDRFDVDRRDGPHLAFAVGAHRCLGEWLGRQQVRIGVERLLARLPGLRLAGDVEVRGFEFRGPVALPVRWDGPDLSGRCDPIRPRSSGQFGVAAEVGLGDGGVGAHLVRGALGQHATLRPAR